MVKDRYKTEYLFAKWMQTGRQHKHLEHILKLYIKKQSSYWWLRSNRGKAKTVIRGDAKYQ